MRQWHWVLMILWNILPLVVFFITDAVVMAIYYKQIGEVFFLFHHAASVYAYYYVVVSWCLNSVSLTWAKAQVSFLFKTRQLSVNVQLFVVVVFVNCSHSYLLPQNQCTLNFNQTWIGTKHPCKVNWKHLITRGDDCNIVNIHC